MFRDPGSLVLSEGEFGVGVDQAVDLLRRAARSARSRGVYVYRAGAYATCDASTFNGFGPPGTYRLPR